MSAGAAARAICEARLVTILRATRPARLIEAARILVEEELSTLELPLAGPGVLEAITKTVEAVGDRGMVGAGTVRTTEDARRANERQSLPAILPVPGCTSPEWKLPCVHGSGPEPAIRLCSARNCRF